MFDNTSNIDLLGTGLVVLMMVALFVWEWLQRKRSDRFELLAKEDIEPALQEAIEFPRLNIQQLQRIGGQVGEVCIIRNIMTRAGGEAGEDFDVSYTAFVIDVNGATHDLATSKNWGEVEEPAKRLAGALDVPFNDSSYGTF